MTTLQLIANYTPAVDVVSLIICAVLHFVIEKVMFYSNERKFIFLKRAINFILLGTGCNIGFYITVSYWANATVAIFLLRILYHMSFLLALYVFLLYMKKMIDIKRTIENIFTYLTRVLFCICVVLDILSPITHLGFYRKNGMWYDAIISPYNFFYAYAYTILFLMLIFYSKRMIRFVRVCLGITGVIVAAIMIYQGVLDINTYTSFTYVLPILVVMILLHSKPFDDKTGALNSASFDNYIRQKVKAHISVDYIVLQLNISMLDTLPDELGKVLNSFWHDAFKDAMSFKLASDVFVLAVPRNKKNGDISEKINKLTNIELINYYNQYKLPYKLIELSMLDFVENVTDIRGIITYMLSTIDYNSILKIDDKKREELRVMKQVKETLADIEKQNNLDDSRVLVYCQPIRNMKSGKYDTAEALMRLSLDGVGMVPPYMFVTMAEEYGYIHTLTKIITNKVSKKIKELEDEGYSFLRISVNVTATDINIDGFCDEMISIIRSNGVEPSKIGVELTESRTDSDFLILKHRMKQLHDAGMTLYLDDIGTGYSNLDRIVQYDVDVVKFDRFFLLEAEKSMKIVKMMTHLSQAFKDLDYKLLFEGVETESHEALCMACGSDYIQGFKYSRPVPIDELRNFFSKTEDSSAEKMIAAIDDKHRVIGEHDFTFYTIEADEEGRPTKLLYTTRGVDVGGKTNGISSSNMDELKLNSTVNDYLISEINNVLYDNMDALLVVSSKDDRYYAVKRTEGIKRFIDEEGSYDKLIEKLMFHMNDSNVKITDEYQVFLPKMKEFKGKYARKINMEIDGIKHVMQMLVYPIEKNEWDYIILLCDLDKSESERDRQMESKAMAMQETYLFSMYVDLNRDQVGNINVSEISNDDMHYDVKYSEWRMMIVNMIWPEDQAMFMEKTDPKYLMAQLKPSKSFSFDCQMKNLEGEYIWVKLIFGRTDTTSEFDFRFVFMVQNIHNESINLFDQLKKYENLASHDALTGVYNHGRIETELNNALDEVRNRKRIVSLMMLDIDYFKSINDTYGHAVGDEVLKAFVQMISDNTEGNEVKIGRWGGEEFVCVCYDCDFDRVLAMAENIRGKVANTMFDTIGAMTCSVGVSVLNKEDNAKDAFVRLDKTLYKAKAQGRNRVCS